jgi:hypothetical protein
VRYESLFELVEGSSSLGMIGDFFIGGGKRRPPGVVPVESPLEACPRAMVALGGRRRALRGQPRPTTFSQLGRLLTRFHQASTLSYFSSVAWAGEPCMYSTYGM